MMALVSEYLHRPPDKPLLYGPGSRQLGEKRSRWLHECGRLLEERKGEEERIMQRKMAVAIGFHLELLLRRWRRRTLLRLALKDILRVAILRWSVSKLRAVARSRRVLGNMVRLLERSWLRGGMEAWWDMVEEWRMRQARDFYRSHLLKKAYDMWAEGRMRARRNSDKALAFRRRHVLQAVWASWEGYLRGIRALKNCLEQSAVRGRRRLLGTMLWRWSKAAKDITLTLMWTGTSLDRALLLFFKKEVWRRWLLFNRHCRVLARVFRLIETTLLRAAFRRLSEARGLRPPLKKEKEVDTSRRPGRPRMGVCRCVYDVSRTGKCLCSFRAHIMRRLALCHELVDEGLAIATSPTMSPGQRRRHGQPASEGRKDRPASASSQRRKAPGGPTSSRRTRSPPRTATVTTTAPALHLDIDGLPSPMDEQESYRPHSVLFPHSTSSHW